MGEENHEVASINTLLLIALILIALVFAYLIKKYKFYYVPESAAAMLLGVVVGGVAKAVAGESEMEFLRFQPEVFFFVLLPPIIFEAAYSLKKKRFFRNFSSIIMFAVLGTLMSTFVVGMLTFAFARAGAIGFETNSPLQSLIFGALISAVDPVATLSIMGSPDLNCDKMLYSLVFGESVLNDAVAIVLFKTFAGMSTSGGEDTVWSSYILLVLKFIGISLGSIAIGLAIGLIACVIFKYTNLQQYPSKETAILVLVSYAAYAMGEVIELSGIMSLFFCGIVLSHYNWYNLSASSKVASHNVFAALAMTTETIVFVYMGMCLFTGEYSVWEPGTVALCILFCLLGRCVNIFPLSYLANCRRKRPITKRMQFIMWFAGLRGAIAFALSLNMPDNEGKWDNDVVVTTTLCIVVFTTVVCGGLTEPLLTRMKLRGTTSAAAPGQQHGHDHDSDDEEGRLTTSLTGDGEEEEPDSRKSAGFHGCWRRFEDKYMRPVFGGSTRTAADDDETEIENRATQELARGEGEWDARRRTNYTPPPIADDGDIGAGTGSFFGLEPQEGGGNGARASPPNIAAPRGQGLESENLLSSSEGEEIELQIPSVACCPRSITCTCALSIAFLAAYSRQQPSPSP